jgi:ankyrin repeat protein
MGAKESTPYPTLIEIIRSTVKPLDLKCAHKELDDYSHSVNIDIRKVEELIDQTLILPLQKCTGPSASELVSDSFRRMLSKYIHTVGTVTADKLPRESLLRVLFSHFFKTELITLLQKISQEFPGPNPVSLLSANDQAVSITLKWIGRNEQGWKHFTKGLDKEHKDRISSWSRGDSIPSSQYIQLLQTWSKGPFPEQINWERVKLWILLSRSIEALKRNSNSISYLDDVRIGLLSGQASSEMDVEIDDLNTRCRLKSEGFFKEIDNLRSKYSPQLAKEPHDKEQMRSSILALRKSHPNESYWIDWLDARWHVMSEDLNCACTLYEKAFNHSLYRSGKWLKTIIEESIVVAASLDKPNKVFLKHLRWANITFGYDIPSITCNTPSNKFEDSIEDWEVHNWRAHLNTIFPSSGYFNLEACNSLTPRKGPSIITNEAAIKPDYRYPDRKIKIGDTWKKTMPQLIWFLIKEDYDVVEKLIQKGANVNVFSDSGDTPIIIALQSLDVTELPYSSLDSRFFELISAHNHNPKIINGRTHKKRLLPITLAVETGRPEIVKKILDLGANPNNRGLTDEQTALNLCIKRIGMIKDPSTFWKNQNMMPPTPEVLDSIRRHTSGAAGFTLEQQKLYMERNKSRGVFTEFERIAKEMLTKRVCEMMTLSNMREIAKLLAGKGADPNAEHISPLRGYTPLMLAAELDERELFEVMLINGGDPAKHYRDPRSQRKINCWDIAKEFSSNEVQQLLDDIKPHFQTRILH